ncbi:MAG: hypothetical protein KC416_02215 [Myxococcales bacterium]|nr:hypothetical protein [Myxococcales bacterium]
MSGQIRPLSAVSPRRAREYGKKAANLVTLSRAGFSIPASYVLSASACQRFLHRCLPGTDWIRTLLEDRHSVSDARLRAIQDRIRTASLPVELRHDIRAFVTLLREGGMERLVVRSSSTYEDLGDASAAGLHTSKLNLMAEEEVFQAVLDCWASLYERSVLSYLREKGLRTEPSMGVLFQALVPSEVAGVLFTVNPLTGDRSEFVINASYGLCSAVVDGRVSPDTYRVDRDTGEVRDAVLGAKNLRAIVGAKGGVLLEPVAEGDRLRLCLDSDSLRQLHDLGLRVETLFGAPQDVEWGMLDGRLTLFQCRPVTVISGRQWTRRSPRDPRALPRSTTVWTNANVGEALPGVATPLTWSVLSVFSDHGFRKAFGGLGCSVPDDAELVANFRGRIYLNLSEIGSIASQVPGLGPRLMLALGGGADLPNLEDSVAAKGHARFYARLPFTLATFLKDRLLFDRELLSFEEELGRERLRFQGLDLRVLSPSGLDQWLWDAENLLLRTGSVLLTGYGNLLLALALLRTVVRAAMPGREDIILRDLVSGFEHIESTEPGLALVRIADLASEDEEAKRVLLESDPERLSVDDLPPGPVKDALVAFLAEFGHRGPREAELASPRWRERPHVIFATLRAQLREPRSSARADPQARLRARVAAEKMLLASVPRPVKMPVRRLLTWVRRLIGIRESLRSRVTEVLGLYRAIALDTSVRFHRTDERYGEDAAFFLTVDEIHRLLTGRVANLAHVVRQRRRQFERDQALPDPPSTFRGQPPAVPDIVTYGETLSGLAASGGYVEGLARVAHTIADASDLSPQEILVVPHADVGWSPLFTVCRGLVAELGGPLSHAAIILREYGVPAAVNVSGATRAVATGDRIAVDGDRGTVHILDRAVP